MAIARSLVLGGRESPKWLASTGRLDKAIDVLNDISKMNHSTHRVTAADFSIPTEDGAVHKTPLLRENLRRAANLFKGPQTARLMTCLILLWLLVGIW